MKVEWRHFRTKRLDRYEQLQVHPWYRQVILNELTEADRIYLRDFLRASEHLPRQQYLDLTSLLFLDAQTKPTRWPTIQEVLAVCAS